MVNKQGKRFTPEEREKKSAAVVEAYVDGAALEEAAERADCSTTSARLFLAEAGIPMRKGHGKTELPEGMLTAKEAAALIGIGTLSLAAMHHRGDGPPRAERPKDAHQYYTYYWQADIEQWLRDRAERRLERLRHKEEEKRAQRAKMAANVAPDYSLDWEALLQAVDAKRDELGFTWAAVCRLTGVDPGHMSRMRNGLVPASGIGTFARLAFWVAGTLPDEIKRFTRASEATAA